MTLYTKKNAYVSNRERLLVKVKTWFLSLTYNKKRTESVNY